MQNIKRIFTFLSNKLKIRHKLFLSLITMILLLSFSTYLFAQHFTNRISDQLIYQYLQTEHRMILDNISMYLDEVVMLSLRYKNNSDFYTILDDTDTTSEEKQKKLLDAASAIWLSDTKAVTNVYLFTPDETVYALKEEKSLPLPTKNCINPELSSPYYYISEPFADADGIWYLPISMKFYNYNTFQEIGYLIFYLPQNAVTNLFYEIFCDSEITFLTDQNGTILFPTTFHPICCRSKYQRSSCSQS